jgi:hypothetical protein
MVHRTSVVAACPELLRLDYNAADGVAISVASSVHQLAISWPFGLRGTSDFSKGTVSLEDPVSFYGTVFLERLRAKSACENPATHNANNG